MGFVEIVNDKIEDKGFNFVDEHDVYSEIRWFLKCFFFFFNLASSSLNMAKKVYFYYFSSKKDIKHCFFIYNDIYITNDLLPIFF